MFKTIGQVAKYKPIAKCGMEELANRQKSIKQSGGVLFARNIDGQAKRDAREKIIDIFRPDKWDRPMNMLTMPGVGWIFERQLLGIRKPNWWRKSGGAGVHFTGVESDRAIYFAAVTKMPGVETPDRLIKPVKRDRFPFAELAVKTRLVSFFFANIDDFMMHKWEPNFYFKQAGWDAAWLDYTGPLSVERLAIIRNFYKNFVREVLIVTALNARWSTKTGNAIAAAGSHHEWLKIRLPGEEIHYLEYSDTSPMVQYAVRKTGLTDDQMKV